MQFRVLLSLIGQLIAVPAALLLVPAAYPDLPLWQATGGASSAGTAVVVEDDAILETPTLPDEGVEERLNDITAMAQKAVVDDDKWRRVGESRRRRGGGSKNRGTKKGARGQEAGGLDELRSRLIYATDGLGEALSNMVQPFHDIPRRAGDVFSSIVRRGVQEMEEEPASDSTARYLAELQLAQESAERALGTPGWEEVAVRNGVTVWKKYFPKDEYGYKYPCVKARGIIDGSAEDVMGMIVDSTRVSEYNRYSVGRTDIEHLGPHTKIVWNKAQPPLTKKLHDFCTLMHMQALDDGAFMLITRATEHPEAPLLEGHVRSEILLGVTILRPAEGDPTRTEMTTVNHIVSNGVPVMIADRVSTKNAIDFIQNVEIAANAAAAATPA